MKIALSLLMFVLVAAPAQAEPATAAGTVYHDLNGNGQREEGEPGLPDVLVSNGVQVVKSDADGRWQLPAPEECVFFLNKPEGWMTPLDDTRLPVFYHVHHPTGSPPRKFPGVAPTGALPESVDFALHRQEEAERFEAIFFGDTQSRDQKELDYMAHDVIEELIGRDSAFGVTLGDVLFDDLSLFGNHNALVALVGVPWYNVLGNHDINFDSPDDRGSDETWTRVFGPPYYMYSWGPVTFFVMDNVDYRGSGNGYGSAFGDDQLKFVENVLPHISEDRLLVFMMHIPIHETEDREKLFRMIEDRPYTMSISGHTHWQAHHFLTEADGWRGDEPHHHLVNVTVCGSWWSGEPDEHGIPHTTMRDGAPNGYSLITFDGNQVVVDFKAARRPATYQMRVHAPDEVRAETAPSQPVYVNVFGGSERSTVRMRVGEEGEWTVLERVLEPDPWFVDLRAADLALPEATRQGRPMKNAPVPSQHLWKAALPTGLAPGTHRIYVQTDDMWGRVFHGQRVIRIVE